MDQPQQSAQKLAPSSAQQQPSESAQQLTRGSTQPVSQRPSAQQLVRGSTQQVSQRPSTQQLTRGSTQPVSQRPSAQQLTRGSTQPVSQRPSQMIRGSTQQVTRPSAMHITRPSAQHIARSSMRVTSREDPHFQSSAQRRRMQSVMDRRSMMFRASRMAGSSILSIRAQSVAGEDRSRIPKFANTYRLESKNPFNVDKVTAILREVMLKELEEAHYDQVTTAKVCMQLSAEIRNRVKQQNYDRYKLICVVHLAENANNSLYTVAGFLWDSDRDNFAMFQFSNSHIQAVAVVYGIYYE